MSKTKKAAWVKALLSEKDKAKISVERDQEADAAYIRFSDNPVVYTTLSSFGEVALIYDFDAGNKLIGVEVIGIASI